MSFARWSHDSNVYVIGAKGNEVICVGCSINDYNDLYATGPSEMITHLKKHQGRGHKVPRYTFEQLKDEMVKV